MAVERIMKAANEWAMKRRASAAALPYARDRLRRAMIFRWLSKHSQLVYKDLGGKLGVLIPVRAVAQSENPHEISGDDQDQISDSRRQGWTTR